MPPGESAGGQLREREEIWADIRALERESGGLGVGWGGSAHRQKNGLD